MKKLSFDNIFSPSKVILCIFALLVVWIGHASYSYMLSTKALESEKIDRLFVEDAYNNVQTIERMFKHYSYMLYLEADLFKKHELTTENITSALSSLETYGEFSKVVAVFPDGASFSVQDNIVVAEDYSYADKMHLGHFYITDVYQDKQFGNVVALNVPIINAKAEVVAFFVGVVSTNKLSDTLNDFFFTEGSYFHLVDQNGAYVADSKASNMLLMNTSFFEALKELTFLEGFSLEKMTTDMRLKISGTTRYSFGKHQRIAYYQPLEINNWVFMAVANQENVEAMSQAHLQNSTNLILKILFVFFLLLFWVYQTQKTLRNNTLVFEKSFKALSEQINQVVFEYNIKTDTIHSISDKNAIRDVIGGDGNHNIETLVARVHPEDIKGVQAAIQTIRDSESFNGVKFRLLTVNGSYIWFMMSGVPILEKVNATPTKALGLIENIHEEENETIALKEKAELDSLTGIYNKGATEHHIKEILANASPSECHCMMIIDVDNFKTLNDTLGHQQGDKVIKDLASKTKSLFRSCDIVGRLGGDEFFVFIQGSCPTDIYISKATQLNELYRQAFTHEDKTIQISASIGISVYPKHGSSFEELYNNADKALYATKAKGKNGYTVYADGLVTEYISSRTDIDR